MEIITNIPSITEDNKRLLRLAAQRYKRAVRMRMEATNNDDALSMSTSTAEFRDAVRALIQLGFPPDGINNLYAEAMVELSGGEGAN